ncbi:MAG: hypothetical protein AAB092_03155, partial [Chloroflexota bacterium]
MALITRPKLLIQKPIAVLVVIALAVTAASIAGVLMLQARLNRSWEEAHLLQEASVAIHGLSALEWQAVAEGEIDESLAGEIDSTLAGIERIVTEVSAGGGEEDVLAAYAVYRDALAKKFEALRAGDIETARAIDDGQVDPAFEALHEIVDHGSLEHAEKARSAGTALNIGTVALIVGAFSLIGFMVLRHEHLVISLNSSLERRVKERTAELEAATVKLQALYLDARDRAAKDPLTGLF